MNYQSRKFRAYITAICFLTLPLLMVYLFVMKGHASFADFFSLAKWYGGCITTLTVGYMGAHAYTDVNKAEEKK